MKLQVLVSTMNQDDNSLIERMNIQTDAIIINQSKKHDYEEVVFDNKIIKVYSFVEKGVGLSRNTALLRATSEICLFADDDVSYVNGYENIIIREFDKNPKADVIIFNVPSTHSERGKSKINKNKRLYFHNIFKFGTYQIAFKLDSIRNANIHFSLLFGGGAIYGSGEDSLFLKDCLKRGLKIYSSIETIGQVSHQESSWFKGYTDKYFFDKGVLYSHLSRRWAHLLCFQYAIRKRNVFKKEKTWFDVYKLMIKGVKKAKKHK